MQGEKTVQTKKFHLGDVLNITTERLILLRGDRGMDGVYDILEFMTGRKIRLMGGALVFPSVPVELGDECKPYLLEQFPQLATPEMDRALAELDAELNKMPKKSKTKREKAKRKKLVADWLAEQVAKYGEELEVTPFPMIDMSSDNTEEEKRQIFKEVAQILTEKMKHHARSGKSLLPHNAKTHFYFTLASLSDLKKASDLTKIPIATLKMYKEIREIEIPRLLKEIFGQKPDLTPSEEEILAGNTWGNIQSFFVAKMLDWAEKTGVDFHILRAFWDGHTPEELQELFCN